jgi:hypothetical protein
MTPCEELGYKDGDKFEVMSVNRYRSEFGWVEQGSSGFKIGDIITLFHDDGSDMPLFTGKNGGFYFADNAPSAYHPLAQLRKDLT